MRNTILKFIIVCSVLFNKNVTAQVINDDVYFNRETQTIALPKNNGQLTESKIENTQLQLDGENLIITYDVIGSTNLDNVWLEIITTKNIGITPKTLSGDINKSITAGKHKKIIWNMRADDVDLQGEELNVKVLAKKPSAHTNLFAEITEEERGTENERRDKIIFKNGNSLTGKLAKRFANGMLKFVSPDGNKLTLNSTEIEKIKNNGLENDSVCLKNGDVICGTINEIYPNNKIIVISKLRDKYSIQCTDIKTVISIFNTPPGSTITKGRYRDPGLY